MLLLDTYQIFPSFLLYLLGERKCSLTLSVSALQQITENPVICHRKSKQDSLGTAHWSAAPWGTQTCLSASLSLSRGPCGLKMTSACLNIMSEFWHCPSKEAATGLCLHLIDQNDLRCHELSVESFFHLYHSKSYCTGIPNTNILSSFTVFLEDTKYWTSTRERIIWKYITHTYWFLLFDFWSGSWILAWENRCLACTFYLFL